MSLAAVLAVQSKNGSLRKVAGPSPAMQAPVLAPLMIQASPLIHCMLKSFVLKAA